MAGFGGFIASEKRIIKSMLYKMRSQIYAKSLTLPMVIGSLKRLEMIRTRPELREKLWNNVRALQNGLRNQGFDLGKTQSPVTPVIIKGGTIEAFKVGIELRETYGIMCSMVIYPVVPKGLVMFRLIPTAVHTPEDIKYTIDAFSDIRKNLDSGKYSGSDIPAVADRY